jgi:hypothetical protein
MPTVISSPFRRPLIDRSISATSAMMPPSPWLSARKISSTYLSVTTITSDQKISDTAP